ncbi:MAG: hypothetical protein VB119_04300 [Candidatus Metalachnospira sp.]|nr:hypothetical protein [Candidatus Metalachnospira sp.]
MGTELVPVSSLNQTNNQIAMMINNMGALQRRISEVNRASEIIDCTSFIEYESTAIAAAGGVKELSISISQSAQAQLNFNNKISEGTKKTSLLVSGVKSLVDKYSGLNGISAGMDFFKDSFNASLNSGGDNSAALAAQGQIQMAENTWQGMKAGIGENISGAVFNLFNAINQNLPTIQPILLGISNVVSVIVDVLSLIVGVVGKIGGVIADNWSVIAPIFDAVVAALILYEAYQAKAALTTLISSAASNIMAFAQTGLNAVIAACPIVWIIGLIIFLVAIIYAVVAAINNVTGSTYSATGIILGSLNVVIQFFKNLLFTAVNIVVGISAVVVALGQNIEAAFSNSINTVLGFFDNLAAKALGVVADIAESLNELPFVNIDTDGLHTKAAQYKAKAQERENNKKEYVDLWNAFNAGSSTLPAFEKDWVADSFYPVNQKGTGLEDSFKTNGLVKTLFGTGDNGSILNTDYSSNTYGTGISNDALGTNVAATAANTGAIAGGMDKTNESLSFLRDAAEREAINRFTTSEVKVDFTSNSTIKGTRDIDGIMTIFRDKLREAVSSGAEEVHAGV